MSPRLAPPVTLSSARPTEPTPPRTTPASQPEPESPSTEQLPSRARPVVTVYTSGSPSTETKASWAAALVSLMQMHHITILPDCRLGCLAPLLRFGRPRRPGRRLLNPRHEREGLADRDSLGSDGHDLVLRSHSERVHQSLGGRLDLVLPVRRSFAKEALEAREEAERVEEGRLAERAVSVGCETARA